MANNIVWAIALLNTMSCSTYVKIDFYENSIKVDEYKGLINLDYEMKETLRNKVVGWTEIVIEDNITYIQLNVYDM